MQKAVIMGVFAEVFIWENENIGLLCVKVPMFCMKSTELCGEEVRCFAVSGSVFTPFSRRFPSFSVPCYKQNAEKRHQKSLLRE